MDAVIPMRGRKMRFGKHWLPPLLWMLVIFVMSTNVGSGARTSRILEPLLRRIAPKVSSGTIAKIHFLVRKAGHLTEYGVLALLVLNALRRSRLPGAPVHAWRTFGWALLITAAYAATDEIHQSFVPGRTGAISDVLIDTTGGLLALAGVALWTRLRRTPVNSGEVLA